MGGRAGAGATKAQRERAERGWHRTSSAGGQGSCCSWSFKPACGSQAGGIWQLVLSQPPCQAPWTESPLTLSLQALLRLHPLAGTAEALLPSQLLALLLTPYCGAGASCFCLAYVQLWLACKRKQTGQVCTPALN